MALFWHGVCDFTSVNKWHELWAYWTIVEQKMSFFLWFFFVAAAEMLILLRDHCLIVIFVVVVVGWYFYCCSCSFWRLIHCFTKSEISHESWIQPCKSSEYHICVLYECHNLFIHFILFFHVYIYCNCKSFCECCWMKSVQASPQ